MMMNDDELAEQMLKEEKERAKFDWHRFAHYFGVHTYNERIKQDGVNEVVKCKYCKVLHLTSQEIKFPSVAFGAFCLIGGLILAPLGGAYLIFGRVIPGIIMMPSGILSIYIALKRFTENIWMI